MSLTADTSNEAETTATPKQRLILRQPNSLRILAFGDSLTEGYTDFGLTFHPYGTKLHQLLTSTLPDTKVEVAIEGLSGDAVLPGLRTGMPSFPRRLYVALELEKEPYDVVIILGGTNDLAFVGGQGLQGAEQIFTEGLKPLYEKVLAQQDCSLVVMTVPERAIDTRASAMALRARRVREHLNGLIKEWVVSQQSSSRVFVLDIAPLMPHPVDKPESDDSPAEEGFWSPDGLHMSVEGYDYVGGALAEMIFDLLK